MAASEVGHDNKGIAVKYSDKYRRATTKGHNKGVELIAPAAAVS